MTIEMKNNVVQQTDTAQVECKPDCNIKLIYGYAT